LEIDASALYLIGEAPTLYDHCGYAVCKYSHSLRPSGNALLAALSFQLPHATPNGVRNAGAGETAAR
jgi:hypothetical protein